MFSANTTGVLGSYPNIAGVLFAHADGLDTVVAEFSSTAQAGDLLLAVFYRQSGNATTPVGYTYLYGNESGSRFDVFYKIAAGGETSVTLQNSVSQYDLLAWTYRINSWYGNSSGIVSGVKTGTSDPPSLTSGFGAGTKTLWIAMAGGIAGPPTLTAYPSGYDLAQGYLTTPNFILGATASKTSTNASEDPGTYGLTAGIVNAYTLAVRGN